MLVPQFWAEGRVQERTRERQITMRRFGWSDLSQEDAQANADRRAREALARAKAGEKLPPREPRLSYNGAAGVPIREEILARHADAVITRNIYGARCLNTPNVLFADIDYSIGPSSFMVAGIFLLLFAAGVSAGIASHRFSVAVAGFFAACILSVPLTYLIHKLNRLVTGSPQKIARRRLSRFVSDHADWRLRVYQTPAGLRVLAMHRTFQPDDPDVETFFKALGTDPVYVQMCLKQQCFRARVSPKPWRVGISDHIRPRPGVWPINPDRLPSRRAWIENYERVAQKFAACRHVDDVGSATIDRTARSVQLLHDELCQAQTELPIA